MSTINLNVDVTIEYSGDEQEALADVGDLIEAMPEDYEGPVTDITYTGWSTR